MAEANRDEVEKCRQIAESALRAGDGEKAVRFLQKAKRMCPADSSIDALLAKAQAASSSDAGGGGGGGDGAGGGVRHSESGSPSPQSSSMPRQRRAEASASSQPTRTNKEGQTYTTEQMKEVQSILRTKDYYEILGVSREASDDQIKKAYKKLALRLHPDKNKAPGAEEAFKKISKAVQCLTDQEKKNVYDRYGDEDRIPQQHRHHYQQDFMTPEDLFAAFFRTGVFQPHGHGHRGGDHGEGDGRAPPPLRQQLMSMLPIILLVLMTLSSNIASREPVSRFSFTKNGSHQNERTTASLRVSYYVADDFEDHYPEGTRSLAEFEQQVDILYVRSLSSDCDYQEKVLYKKIVVARSRGTKEDVEKARKTPKPACKEMERIKQRYPNIYRSAVYVGF